MEQVQKCLANDRFAARCGIELVSVEAGRARAKMKVEPTHWNGVGTAQGGAIFTLADFAFAAASNAHGTVSVAVNTNMTFMKAAVSGTLWAEARENARNAKLGSYTVEIRDDNGELIGIFQGMAYRKKDPLPVVRPGSKV